MKLEGYSNYEIYPETGLVWSYKRNKFIGAINADGYVSYTLVDDSGKHNCWLGHRLMWRIVNGNIPMDMEINHIDENKSNNSITNLSLMSHKENCNWGTRNERGRKKRKNNVKQSKPIIALQNGIIKFYFPSVKEAQRNGYILSAICKCCRGELKHHRGLEWHFVENYLADWWDKEMDEYMKKEKAAQLGCFIYLNLCFIS